MHFVRELYNSDDFIPLHAPIFKGNEKRYLNETIDSTYVSSVGGYVDQFEQRVAEFVGAKHAIATVNGTAALHMALQLVGVEKNTEVITQSLTFVATCNAICYCNAVPVLIDVDRSTLGLSPAALADFLDEYCEMHDDGSCWNKETKRRVVACLPMHTFGFPVKLDEIKQICDRNGIALVEDAAESLGSFYKDKHTGMTGKAAAISFNGNKIITTGGGGMILTDDDELALRARHITTTAKRADQWEFVHDEVGYNYRLPNLNAALGVAQMERLSEHLKSKRKIAQAYQQWGNEKGVQFIADPLNARSNYWLNTMLLDDREERDQFLMQTNEAGVMTRPSWVPMHQLAMYKDLLTGSLCNTNILHECLLNVPSSASFL